MADYNSVMNERIYGICNKLSDEILYTDIGLFFGSIHRTLDHILYGDMAWILRFESKEHQVPELDDQLYDNFTELSRARTEWDAKIVSWSASICEDWLAQDLSYLSKVDGRTRTKKTWLLVTHMFNHETHHRGQLTTGLNQMGYDCGVTDLPFLI